MQRTYPCCTRNECGCAECASAQGQCPPQPCCCEPPARPMKPFPPGGILLPRILAAGREWQRRCSLSLCVNGLPATLEPPLTLLEVTSCGQCSWEVLSREGFRALCLRVHVPLCCQVRDRCNTLATGNASISVDVRLRFCAPQGECWRGSFLALPCVRLVCIPCASEQPVFDALLEVLVEAYLARWEPCMNGNPPPICPPDLPLFPQPCFR